LGKRVKKIKVKKGSKEWFRWKRAQVGEMPPADPKAVLAGDMWAHLDFGDPNDRYQKFLSVGRPRFSRLLDSTMLYDKVFIPTQDFMSATVLVGVLGDRAVLDMLEAGDVKFIRLRGALAYIGNGGGIAAFEIHKQKGIPHATFADDEEALDWALGGLEQKPDPLVHRLILRNTQIVNMDQIADLIKGETYQDILKSQHLRDAFAIRNTHLDRLVGIGPDQVRIAESLDPAVFGDEIDTVLRISRANLELHLAMRSGCLDSTTGTPMGHLLKGKRERINPEQAPFENYATLKELAGIPDLSAYVLDASVDLRHYRVADLLRAKHTRDGDEFRTWFHANCRTEGAEVARRYIDLLQQTQFTNTLPGKTVRFLATTAAGFLDPIAGIVVGAVDSLFGDFLRRSSPKFFIEDLRQIR
jgi:hypothetical protein